MKLCSTDSKKNHFLFMSSAHLVFCLCLMTARSPLLRQPRGVYSTICAVVQKRSLSVWSSDGWKSGFALCTKNNSVQHDTNISCIFGHSDQGVDKIKAWACTPLHGIPAAKIWQLRDLALEDDLHDEISAGYVKIQVERKLWV